MRPRVVADTAESGLLACERPVLQAIADDEERRVRVTAAQDADDLRGVRAGAVVERQGDGIAVTAAARDDRAPREQLLDRLSLLLHARDPGRAVRGRFERRRRRRDEGDEEHGGDRSPHHIRARSASTFATNGLETL